MERKRSARTAMLDVIQALAPAVVASVLLFGPRALLILAASVTACVLGEYLCRRAMRRENTVGDLSAAVTGTLLALSLPVTIHPLIAAVGGVFAVAAVKQPFGGLGKNPVNPALAAHILLLLLFPAAMTAWVEPRYYLDPSHITAAATPLELLRQGSAAGRLPNLTSLLLGNTAGCLGTCAAALLLGGIYLAVRRVIAPVIPLCCFGAVAALSFAMGRSVPVDLLSGGLPLGAVFMATDPATAPRTAGGRAVFGAGCGIAAMLIRRFVGPAGAVACAVVLMNLLAPLIDRAARRPAPGKESAGG